MSLGLREFMKNRPSCVFLLALPAMLAATVSLRGEGVDLLKRYPTQLTAEDFAPERARTWKFELEDTFLLSRFSLAAGEDFRVETGPADLGIGHCADGAIWAVLMPRAEGKLTSPANAKPETIAHIWLRFHPAEISRLFPPETVSTKGVTNLVAQMRRVANFKIGSSCQAGGKAMIPPRTTRMLDVDTKDGLRRFFVVDTQAGTAEYENAFLHRPLKLPPPITTELAGQAFDKLWAAFDKDYAMFALRPEVDWAQLREKFRPQALQAQSTDEFAATCAEMLKSLRDLHVWLTLAGEDVPVFNRPRAANANPSAHKAILGSLHNQSRPVQWAVTADKVGYIAIYGWHSDAMVAACAEALEQMRNTRGLIVDVRLNGGGDEPTAEKFACRFVKTDFVYAYSQFRNGPSHTNLTEKYERSISPDGPWRYNRPVVVLIGQKCMSSNESLVAMMSGDEDATIMGDHTCGSSGNPEIIHLPLDMTVSVPRWIDYLPDGTPLDERGFQPHRRCRSTPDPARSMGIVTIC
jgi:hypothetical protein